MQQIIAFLGVWIIVLPLFLGVILFRNFAVDSKIVFVIVAIGTIPQLIHYYAPASTIENITYNLYIPLEYGCYWALYYPKTINKWTKRIFLISCIISVVAAVLLVSKNGIVNRFISEWLSFNNICYLIWVCIFISEEFIHERNTLSYKRPFFWFTIGILSYAACTSVVYSLWPQMQAAEKGSPLKLLFKVQNLFNIGIYIFFAIGMLVDSADKKAAK